MHPTRPTRYLWWALVLLHLGLPGWCAVADARLLVPGPRDEHVERDNCAPSHALDCRFCTFLRAPVEAPEAVGVPVLPTVAVLPFPAPAPSRGTPADALTPLPRGPPASI